MELHFSVTGERRKALVQSISEITGDPAVYASGAGRSYALGELMVDKDGVLDYSRHDGFIHPLVSELAERGFPCEPQDGVLLKAEEQSVPCIEMPLEGFTEATLANLERLVASKAGLIKKAVGAEALPIEQTESTLRFPWFSAETPPDEVKAYAVFISRLCATAKAQKRITAVERSVDNEKYAFRCFLLKLVLSGTSTRRRGKCLWRGWRVIQRLGRTNNTYLNDLTKSKFILGIKGFSEYLIAVFRLHDRHKEPLNKSVQRTRGNDGIGMEQSFLRSGFRYFPLLKYTLYLFPPDKIHNYNNDR